jgi:hypothetical protein
LLRDDPSRLRRLAQCRSAALSQCRLWLTPVLQATRTIPIVMVNVPDPVGAGWVQSLAVMT